MASKLTSSCGATDEHIVQSQALEKLLVQNGPSQRLIAASRRLGRFYRAYWHVGNERDILEAQSNLDEAWEAHIRGIYRRYGNKFPQAFTGIGPGSIPKYALVGYVSYLEQQGEPGDLDLWIESRPSWAPYSRSNS